MQALLSDATQARRHMDVLVNSAGLGGEINSGYIDGTLSIGKDGTTSNGQGITVSTIATTTTLKPVIDSTFEFEDAAAAFQRIESGRHFGKIVIRV